MSPQIGPYFFYGSLQHAPLLSHILSLPTATSPTPVLRPAKILAHRIKLWGPYPALVQSTTPTSEVHGMVYDVKTEEHARRLARYETERYEAMKMDLEYMDQEGGKGECWVFRWCGLEGEGEGDLKDGNWELGLFLMRMGIDW